MDKVTSLNWAILSLSWIDIVNKQRLSLSSVQRASTV